MSSPIINSGSSEGQNTQSFVDIEADILATANAATSNAQHTGPAVEAAQVGGQAAVPLGNNDFDPWHGQKLPQRTYDGFDETTGGHWDNYNMARCNATPAGSYQQYPFQHLPGQGVHQDNYSGQPAYDANWNPIARTPNHSHHGYVPETKGNQSPMQPPSSPAPGIWTNDQQSPHGQPTMGGCAPPQTPGQTSSHSPFSEAQKTQEQQQRIQFLEQAYEKLLRHGPDPGQMPPGPGP